MPAIKHTGGGRFDPADKHIYFAAGGMREDMVRVNPFVLIAMNELAQDGEGRFGPVLSNPDVRVFLDSGVYNLAMSYARNHNVSMDIGLSMNPEDMGSLSMSRSCANMRIACGAMSRSIKAGERTR